MTDTLNDIIQRHLDWCPRSNRLQFLSLALCGEAGEFANLLKKEWRDGKIADPDKLRKELADIGAYALMIAQCLDVDLIEEIKKKVIEVEQRPEWQNRKTK